MPVPTPVAPKEEDRESIKQLLEALARHADAQAQIVIDGEPGETLVVPRPVFDILRQVAEVMASGRAISVVPIGMMLSTQQAAELVGVSRPFLISVIEKGELPFVMVGTHRRVRIEDLLAYKQQRETTRDAALRRLSEQAERLKLEY